MNREWKNSVPWWEVCYTVYKGEFTEFDNKMDVQAETQEAARKIAEETLNNCYIWGIYRK